MELIRKPIKKIINFNENRVGVHKKRISLYEGLIAKYEEQKKIYEESGLEKESNIFADKIDKVKYELSLEYKYMENLTKQVDFLYNVTSKIS